MVELTIIFIVVAFIGWIVWTERKSKLALDKDLLDQAWREVLDDPHYMERRHYEERERYKIKRGPPLPIADRATKVHFW